jgi:hypothetical protein
MSVTDQIKILSFRAKSFLVQNCVIYKFSTVTTTSELRVMRLVLIVKNNITYTYQYLFSSFRKSSKRCIYTIVNKIKYRTQICTALFLQVVDISLIYTLIVHLAFRGPHPNH